MDEAFKLAPQQWALLRALLDEALALPAADRAAWLAGLDEARHAGLKPRLNSLLAHAAAEGGPAHRLLDTLPQVETGQFAPPPRARADPPVERVGAYRLLRLLGEGGMGEVWLAERTDMLQGRQVALKLPHGAWRRSGLVERLAREREILATLEHPNIARLYDAGVSSDGQPYLALEVVEGERIDAWCERKALSVAARVRLFLQVARAVAHAHAALVLHRDLKPGNILVTEDGTVKLLDFGIAKLMEQGVAEATALTLEAGRALTPEYASPEQLQGRPVGTASDVYALGVVLYELLAGTRPWQRPRDLRAALDASRTAADPPPPSARAPTQRHGTLRGDLDTIVLKALQHEPARRYATVAALADDLQRHLDHQPVLARPDSLRYRTGRFVRRHRGAMGAGGAVVTALLAGTVLALWQADTARTEQQRAEAVKRFVAELFLDADPFRTTSREPTVAGLLQTAERRLALQVERDPALRLELLNMVGASLQGLSRFEDAGRVLAKAVAEGRSTLGADHALTLRARLSLLAVERTRGRLASVQAELDALMPLLRSRRDSDPDLLLQALTALTHLAIDQGRPADAMSSAAEALELATRLHGDAHPRTAAAALGLSSAAIFGEDSTRALQLATRSREMMIALHGRERPHAGVLDARFVYGRALGKVGRFGDAVLELDEVLAQVRALLGPEAYMAGFVAADLARIRLELGEPGPAVAHARLALAVVSRDLPPDSAIVAMARLGLGRALVDAQQAAEAQTLLDDAHAVLSRLRGPTSPLALEARALRAMALLQQGRAAEAWAGLGPELAAMRSSSTVSRFRGLHAAGLLRSRLGDPDGARAFQREALAAMPADAVNAPRRQRALDELARLDPQASGSPAARPAKSTSPG